MDPVARTKPRLTDAQRLAWLRLIRSENVGPVAFRQLVNRFGSAAAALDALPDLVRRGGKRTINIAPLEAAEREMELARATGAEFVALGEAPYPRALLAADGPPPLLAVLGSMELLGEPCVGIVGSRNASVAGAKITKRIAETAGQGGYAIVSGLARGIDAAAHEASLATGTIACLAGGLDKPFPPENVPLMRRIVEDGGAVVSEMPFGWVPRARDFPRRNRLIAGSSLAVVIVEAAQRSGSLITARLANEMGRLVFAVPGSPLDPRAMGTNALIKQGAIMLTRAQELLDELRPMEGSLPQPVAQETLFDALPDRFDPDADEPATGERERVVEALSTTPILIDEVISHADAHPAVVHTALLELELAGRLERHSGGFVSLVLADL